MSKFGFGDFITLAKSGWTPETFNAALDRIETMNAAEADDGDQNQDDANQNQNDANQNQDDANQNQDNATQNQDDVNQQDEKDARIAELEKQLKAAQQHNRQQDNSGGEQKTLDDLVDDIFTEFFD